MYISLIWVASDTNLCSLSTHFSLNDEQNVWSYKGNSFAWLLHTPKTQ
jgi:hypothetical protein